MAIPIPKPMAIPIPKPESLDPKPYTVKDLPLVSREWRNGNYYKYHYYHSSIPY